MQYPFYDKYTINDDHIGCHRVIYVDCDGVHRYKTVCELAEECLPLKQLKNDCIVDFLNSNLSNSAGKYLRITSNGCLTASDPVCPCDDRKVWATDWDTQPDTLDKKLVWGCDPTGTYCISVGTPSPNQVQVLPSGPINWFTQFKGTATCDNSIVKMNKNGQVYVECPEIPWNLRYAYAIHTGGDCSIEWNRTGQMMANDLWPKTSNTFSGHWDIFATPWFSKNKEDGFINIEEPWLYLFTYASYIIWDSPMVYALRAGLWIGGAEVWDFKYNWPRADTYWGFKGDSINWFFPNVVSGDQWAAMVLSQTGASFAGSFVHPVSNASKANPVSIKFIVKPDTRTNDKRHKTTTPTVVSITDHTAEVWPKTYISITKISDDSAYKTIKKL